MLISVLIKQNIMTNCNFCYEGKEQRAFRLFLSRHVKENGGRQLLAMVPRWGWGLKGIKEKANMAKVLKVITSQGEQ